MAHKVTVIWTLDHFWWLPHPHHLQPWRLMEREGEKKGEKGGETEDITILITFCTSVKKDLRSSSFYLFATYPTVLTYSTYFPFLLYFLNRFNKPCDMCILIYSVGLLVCFSLAQTSWKCIWRLPLQWGNSPICKGILSPQTGPVSFFGTLKISVTACSSPCYKIVSCSISH